MYITTFYSFKGGVGRTFALVNVAIELAKSGSKVLLVDFDLEAPGIDTFSALSPKAPHAGLVEFVTQYIATQSSPDVRDFVYEREDFHERERQGRIWVMPAGRGDQDFRQRLSSINWRELYSEHEGYLFFQDLKAQWNSAFAPDYVLIDSRTGHTDVEGICTRQLPDAVVVLFFPNEQNLSGLREVVQDIVSETERSRKGQDPITLHFVMSNVPDLDDEDGILRNRIKAFRRALKCDSFGVVHNYPSLALLNQSIFTLERPKSRLAREYRRIKEQIVDGNDDDVEGVIRYLREFEGPRLRFARRKNVDDRRLNSIVERHSDNGEVLFHLGLIRKGQGDLTQAISHFTQAIELGYRECAGLVERATCYAMKDDLVQKSRDLSRLLEIPDLGDFELQRATQLLDRNDKELWTKVARSNALQRADPNTKFMIASKMLCTDETVSSVKLLEQLVSGTQVSIDLRNVSRNKLVLALMGMSDISGAMRVVSASRPSPCYMSIEDTFNYAMAEWAHTGKPPTDLFSHVIEEAGLQAARDEGPNFEQCLAVSFWAVGKQDEALQRLERAKNKAQEIRNTEFSCWRYQDTSRQEFLEDCEAIHMLLVKGEGKPLFFPKG